MTFTKYVSEVNIESFYSSKNGTEWRLTNYGLQKTKDFDIVITSNLTHFYPFPMVVFWNRNLLCGAPNGVTFDYIRNFPEVTEYIFRDIRPPWSLTCFDNSSIELCYNCELFYDDETHALKNMYLQLRYKLNRTNFGFLSSSYCIDRMLVSLDDGSGIFIHHYDNGDLVIMSEDVGNVNRLKLNFSLAPITFIASWMFNGRYYPSGNKRSTPQEEYDIRKFQESCEKYVSYESMEAISANSISSKFNYINNEHKTLYGVTILVVLSEEIDSVVIDTFYTTKEEGNQWTLNNWGLVLLPGAALTLNMTLSSKGPILDPYPRAIWFESDLICGLNDGTLPKYKKILLNTYGLKMKIGDKTEKESLMLLILTIMNTILASLFVVDYSLFFHFLRKLNFFGQKNFQTIKGFENFECENNYL